MLVWSPSTCVEFIIWILFCARIFYRDIYIATRPGITVIRSMKFIRGINFNFILEFIFENIVIESDLITHIILRIFFISFLFLLYLLSVKVAKEIFLSLLFGWNILLVHLFKSNLNEFIKLNASIFIKINWVDINIIVKATK